MVDKVWSDWQQESSSNFWAFEGGAVQAMDNVTEFTTYPTGAPPALKVRNRYLSLMIGCYIIFLVLEV